jgi:hypothetical protein
MRIPKLTRQKIIISLGIALTLGAALSVAAGTYLYSRLQRGWNDEPPQTQRAFIARDIVGTWRYQRSDFAGTITITFNFDGTFDQQVKLNGSRETLLQHGQWAIRREHPGIPAGAGGLDLNGVLTEGAHWKPRNFSWDVVESDLRSGQLGIAGSPYEDADTFQELEKLTQTK